MAIFVAGFRAPSFLIPLFFTLYLCVFGSPFFAFFVCKFERILSTVVYPRAPSQKTQRDATLCQPAPPETHGVSMKTSQGAMQSSAPWLGKRGGSAQGITIA